MSVEQKERCTLKASERHKGGREMNKNLDQKIRRYKAMEKHRMMVRKGQLKAAKLMLRLLRTGSVSLGLDC